MRVDHEFLRRSIPGRGNRECKDHKQQVSWMYLKDCQKASIQQEAGVECAERSKVGDEMGERVQVGVCMAL